MSNQLTSQFTLLQTLRDFFNQNGFTDVLTPPIVENPGMETHIHPFELMRKISNQQTNLYLRTSPEFHMKEILANQKNLNDIFTISYSFRDEPSSPIHRNQFIMLEWYRRDAHYSKIMDDVQKLIDYSQTSFVDKGLIQQNIIHTFPQVTVQDIFHNFLGFDILNFLEAKELKNKIKKDFKDVPLPEAECTWDDYFFLLFLNRIEPQLKHYPYLLLKEFPAPLSALSTLSQSDSRVCERFEVYLSGIELCNCFNELTDADELEKRFKKQMLEKQQIYGYTLPWPERFMKVMSEGYPKSAGIALGVERLLYALNNKKPFFD